MAVNYGVKLFNACALVAVSVTLRHLSAPEPVDASQLPPLPNYLSEEQASPPAETAFYAPGFDSLPVPQRK